MTFPGLLLYVKTEQSVKVQTPQVTIADVSKICCADQKVKDRVKKILLYTFDKEKEKEQFQTFSALYLIALIKKECPEAEVFLLGEPDFIVHYEPEEANRILQVLKTILIGGIAFFGAAFMIITFCKEVSIVAVLDMIYTRVTQKTPGQITLMDVSFCVGLPLGVMLFYNHLGRKKFSEDPTPLQVAMGKYEKDVDSACIEESGREGRSVDVD